MAREIAARPLTKAAFAGFGDVIETAGAEQRLINAGTTTRFHDLAGIDVADNGGRPLISLFRGQPFAFPVEITTMERHPLGSQAFFPLATRPFLVVVAPDDDGRPGTPRAFLAAGDQGVNYAKNICTTRCWRSTPSATFWSSIAVQRHPIATIICKSSAIPARRSRSSARAHFRKVETGFRIKYA